MPMSSRLLINEPPMVVLPSLAVAVGLHGAIILQQIHYWASGPSGHERNGRRWTYNSVHQWHQQIPFLSAHQLRDALEKLEASKCLIVGEFNQDRRDRTKWYSVDYDELDKCICPPAQMHLSPRATAFVPQDEPLPETPKPETPSKIPGTTAGASNSEFLGEMATQWEANGFGHLMGMNAEKAKDFEDAYLGRWKVPPAADLARYVVAEGASKGARNWAYVEAILKRAMEHGGIPPKMGDRKNGHKPDAAGGKPAVDPNAQLKRILAARGDHAALASLVKDEQARTAGGAPGRA